MVDETPAPAPVPAVEPAPAPSKVSVVFTKAKAGLQWVIGLVGKYPGTALFVAIASHALRSVL